MLAIQKCIKECKIGSLYRFDAYEVKWEVDNGRVREIEGEVGEWRIRGKKDAEETRGGEGK